MTKRPTKATIRSRWQQWLPWCVGIGDASVVVCTLSIAHVVRFGTMESQLEQADVPYSLVGVFIAILWIVALGFWRSWEIRVLGSSAAEYVRVLNATLATFGGLAIFAYVFDVQLARGYVAVAVPVGVALIISWRWVARSLVVRMRRRGLLSRRLVLIGGPGEVLQLFKSFERSPGAGFEIVGVVLPGRSVLSPDGKQLPLPVLSVDRSADAIVQALDQNNIEVVAITGGGLSPRNMRTLSWALAERLISLILVPALTDVAGPRIHSYPVADLPLIHVTTPRLNGFNATLKRVFDILGASAAMLLCLPILIVAALAIKIDDGGPVFFTQRRVGKNHSVFRLYKLRSMSVDADSRLSTAGDPDAGNTMLFKMKNDPRVTRVGRFIRKYSIDELPQLLNVLLGTMSMVGPRPPLEDEVDRYEHHVHRRLNVKPGITGLWQTRGRSNLDWDESVRLDLYYVENWSIMQDLVILFRTVRVVLSREGAY